jgi:hypothetical protein
MRSAVVPVVLGLLSGLAHANGRAPITNGIFFKPNDSHTLYVRSTFGLLISHDDGCTFDWVCEQNVGYGGNFDPKYTVTTDGAILAGTPNGLRISRDGGCSFTTATPDEWVETIDIASTGDIWIGTATVGQSNQVFRSTDNGTTFQPMGLSTAVEYYQSLKVAPSDATRIYVTSNEAATTPAMHLYRSDNAGGIWTPELLTGVAASAVPLANIAAVDPTNADLVYLVSVGASAPAGDILYRSTDGAKTFTPVLTTQSAIRDVVIQDATHVFVTTTVVTMNGNEMGGPAYASTNSGVAFTAMTNAPQLDCLGRRPDGTLAGCGANWGPDFMAVTKSPDAAAWTKVWRFVELNGPLSCPAGTAEHDTCDVQLWAGIQQQFGTTGPACGVNAGDGSRDETAPPPKSGGCCDGGSPMGVIWAGALAMWILRRRA